jgi:hypothetical protein
VSILKKEKISRETGIIVHALAESGFPLPVLPKGELGPPSRSFL